MNRDFTLFDLSRSIGGSFITTFLVITIFSASAAIDPNMILYYSFDEQIDGRQVEDLTGGGNHGKLKLGAKLTNVPAEVYKGTGAVKFTNISSQVRVDPFQKLDTYKITPTPFNSIYSVPPGSLGIRNNSRIEQVFWKRATF